MNLKGHINTGILLTNTILLFPFIQKSLNIESSFTNKYISIIRKIYLFLDINNLNILFITILGMFFILGNIFPDLDHFFNKNNKNHYTMYHRQITHSLIIFGILFLLFKYLDNIIIYFNFNNIINNNIYYFFKEVTLFFILGILCHIFVDIFVGKGGVPLIYTKNWKSNYRLSIPIFNNSGIFENMIYVFSSISILFILYIGFFISFKQHFLLEYKIYYILLGLFYLFISNKIKNTISSFLYILFGILFLFLFLIF